MRPDQHAVADLGMAVLFGLAGAAQGHALQDRDIVADGGGLPDHEAGGMVEHDALADPCGRVDVDLEHGARAALQVEREILASHQPQRMREAMRLDGVKALEIEEAIDRLVQRRVPLQGRREVGPCFEPDLRTRLERLTERLADQVGGNIGVVQPLGQPVGERIFEAVVIEHVGIEQIGQRWLAGHHLSGPRDHCVPHRVHGRDIGRLQIRAHNALHRRMPI